MVLRLQYLKYRTSGRQLFPYFLKEKGDEEVPQRIINHLETYIGTTRRDLDLEAPLTWVPDTRIARALIATAMNRYYAFEPQRLEDLVSPRELRELHQQGISDLEAYRLWYWQSIERKYGGFITQSYRDEVLSNIAATLRIRSDTVKRLLKAHRDENMLLQRRGVAPSIDEFIGAYNFEVLETLLYNSESVTVSISGASLGSVARALLQLTKRFGVLVDLEQIAANLQATIAGPRIFFGRASAFGWNIAQVLTRILLEATQLKFELAELKIDVVLRERQYIVTLAPDDLPVISPRGEPRKNEAFLDSKVEKQFYWSWQNNKFRGWDIIREPDAFFLDSHLIVPDFALVKDNKKVLVEIIGYWREEYTQKKQHQLELLQKLGLKSLILLIDNKYRRHFVKSAYPIVYYRTRGNRYEIPYGKILKLLPE